MEPATNANSMLKEAGFCKSHQKHQRQLKLPQGSDATAVPECPMNCTVKSSEEENVLERDRKHRDVVNTNCHATATPQSPPSPFLPPNRIQDAATWPNPLKSL